MEIDIWILLLIYSFVQGYLLAIYALLKLKNFFLFGLLFVVSTLIVGYLYYQLGWFKIYPEFIFFEAPFWYLIGPFFFLFVKNIFSKRTPWWEYIIHLTPFLLFLIFITPFYFLENPEKLSIYLDLFSISTYEGDPNHYLFSVHRIVYILITIFSIKKYSKEEKVVTADSNLIYDDFAANVLNYYLWYSIAALAFYFFLDQFYSQISSYFSILYLLLSILIHLTFYYAFIRETSLNENVINKNDDLPQKYSSSNLTVEELDSIIYQLKSHISKKDIFSNSSLRLRSVAEELDIPSHKISQAINTVLDKNFFDLVNEQRVNAVKENINNPDYKNYTLVAIALDFGFKSSSSFYRIFKKYTGMTPNQYLISIRSK